MGRPERPVDPESGPVEHFAAELRRLREAAGRPGYRVLARRAHYSMATLAEAAGGRVFPSLAVTLTYVEACGGDKRALEARWHEVAQELATANMDVQDLSEAPYRGLETFESTDAEWFFGRQRLVDQLLQRLSTMSFMAVFGPSGSGKSSILRAGLLPALGRDAILGSKDWPVLLFTPGGHPMRTLAAGLANLTGGSARSLHHELMSDPDSIRLVLRQMSLTRAMAIPAVLVVDQFEEVFTLCGDAEERACFIDCLLAAVDHTAEDVGDHGSAGCRVVLGIRADFYSRCAQYPALVAALYDRQLLVGAMSDDELREVITGPATRAGLKIERALVEVIVGDARGEPGALPLVSHALLETWRRRRADVLSLAAYRGAGGIRGAIAQTAEQVFDGFDPRQQRIARQMFLRLTALGEDTEDTRRRVQMAELLGGPDSAMASAVLERLSVSRLLTVNHDEVQVAHEAIIRHWPRLRGWLTDDRELLHAHRHLTEAAVDWDQQGRDDGLLYRGVRLAAWDNRDVTPLNALEREFLSTSRSRHAHESRASRRRLRLAATGLVSALTAVSLLAATALVQAVRATDERDLAVTRQLMASARSQLTTDPATALQLARRAYEIKPTAQSEDVLRQATLEAGLSRIVSRPGIPVGGVTFSPDGRWLAVHTPFGIHMYALTANGAVRRRVLSTDGGERAPVFHPSGRYLATVDGFGKINIWDLSNPSIAPVWFGKTFGKAFAIAFSPDGRWLASADSDGTVRVWNWAARGHESVVLGAFSGKAMSVAFGPDGRHVAAAGSDGTIRIWDRTESARSPVVLRSHKGSVETVAFSPDGRRIASGGDDGIVRIWNATGKGKPHVLIGHTGAVESVAFSPDGRRIASGGKDGAVRIWDATPTGSPVAPLLLGGSLGEVSTVAFSPDGRSVADGDAEGVTRLWDVTGSGDPVTLRGHVGPVWDAAASRDGRKIVSAGEDGTVRIWNTDGTGDPVILRSKADHIFGVTFSPDGTRVAGIDAEGTIQIWNTNKIGDPITLSGGPKGVQGVTFTSDGRQIVSIGRTAAYRWNAAQSNSEPTISGDPGGFDNKVIPAPPTTSLQARITNGTVRAYLNDPNMWQHHRGLAFMSMLSANNQIIASMQEPQGRSVVLRNRTANYSVVLRGNQGRLRSVAVSPDGQLVATTAVDNTVRIWRSNGEGEPLVFRGHGLSAENINFTPDGHLITTYDDGTIRIWRCDVCGPIHNVLRLADQRTQSNN
jgi:WD40 repeat protein